MGNSLTETENRPNPADPATTGRARFIKNSLDVGLVLFLPLLSSFEFVALGKPDLPILALVEIVPLGWLVARRSEFPRSLGERLAWIASGVLSLFLFFGLSLPKLSGALPEFVRYELSLWLGSLRAGIPLGSLVIGGLALGLSHLGGTRLALLFDTSDSERGRLHDLYFVFSALLAHLTIARYAGGPFFG